YGVPPWVGLITERSASDGAVQVQLKSAEWLMQKKLTGSGLTFGAQGGDTSATIAYGLFQSAYLHNCRLPNLRPGAFTATRQHFKQYDYVDLYEEIRKLADEDGAAFWIDENLLLHFTNTRGTNKTTTIKLREGKHLVNVRTSESAEDVLTAAVS